MITITQVGRQAGALAGKAWRFRTDDEDEALRRFARKQHPQAAFRIDSRAGARITGKLMGVPGYGRGIEVEVVIS
jgi:hypothetical protein